MLSLLSFDSLCNISDWASLQDELTQLKNIQDEKDCVLANQLLEETFDNLLKKQLDDDPEALKAYFANKDGLRDFYGHYANKLASMKNNLNSTLEDIQNYVTGMFKDIKEKLLGFQRILNGNTSESFIGLQGSRNVAPSETTNMLGRSGKDHQKENRSLRGGALSDFDAVSASKGWSSAHCSPESSPKLDAGTQTQKKGTAKSRFNELAQEAKMKNFQNEWPVLQQSQKITKMATNLPLKLEEDISPLLNSLSVSPQHKKPSDMYADNSPSLISLMVKDDKKVIKDRVTPFDVLMKNAWYLKKYLRDVPLKKQEIAEVIENYYFDDKELSDALEEHICERNNTKTLRRIQQLLENQGKPSFKHCKKVVFTCKQTLEFMGFFDIISKEWIPLLRSLYEKLDTRIYDLWDEFTKSKKLIEFGKKLVLLGGKVTEERRAYAKKVGRVK